MVGVFGTMAADLPYFLGVPLWATSAGYLLAVSAIFGVWYRLEGTLSFSGITGGRRETFYWAAVLATFALGTAVGDLTEQNWGLGPAAGPGHVAGQRARPALAARGDRGHRALPGDRRAVRPGRPSLHEEVFAF